MDFILEGLARAFVLLLQGDREIYSAVWATVQTASMSMTVSLLLGIRSS
jgi:tungstate transport system permease protein